MSISTTQPTCIVISVLTIKSAYYPLANYLKLFLAGNGNDKKPYIEIQTCMTSMTPCNITAMMPMTCDTCRWPQPI